MRTDLRGRQACVLSPYHQATHAQAVARAACMLDMRAAGFDDQLNALFAPANRAVFCRELVRLARSIGDA